MHQNAENRCQNLIASVEKFFFSKIDKVLCEFKESLFYELKKKPDILQNQKNRIQEQLNILEKELAKSQTVLQSNSVQEIITVKTALFDSLSEISQTFLVPQRTDNLHISCSNFTFNQPDSPFNPVDEKVIVESILGSFNKLLGLELSILSLKQLEKEIKDNPDLETQRNQREEVEKINRENKSQEESTMKERMNNEFKKIELTF